MFSFVEWMKEKHLSADEDVRAFCAELSESYYSSRAVWRKRLIDAGLKFHNRLPGTLATLEIGFSSCK